MIIIITIFIYSELITSTNGSSIVTRNAKDSLCVSYKRNENGESNNKPLFAVVVADQYFPCLPRVSNGSAIKTAFKSLPSSNSSHNSVSSYNSNSINQFSSYRDYIKEGAIHRSIAPFTKVCKTEDEKEISILSCIAYFEVKIHEDDTRHRDSDTTNGTHNPTSKNSFSIGLACPLFPLRRKHPGFDNYSFGYHCDGKFRHRYHHFSSLSSLSSLYYNYDR